MKIAFWLTLVICLQFTGSAIAANTVALQVNNRDEAIQLVKRQHSGKVLKVQPTKVNGHSGYQVKMISNEGVVYSLTVDAVNGQVNRK